MEYYSTLAGQFYESINLSKIKIISMFLLLLYLLLYAIIFFILYDFF